MNDSNPLNVLTLVQLNCQESQGVMSDFGESMRLLGARVAMLQEPYHWGGSVRGLPASMNVFMNGDGGSAIVIDDVSLDCMAVEEYTNDLGVCVRLGGAFGVIYVASIYCRHANEIEPYIEYLRGLTTKFAGEALIVGMDANAVSPLWFSKGETRGRRNEVRGEILEEFLLGAGLDVLNQPSEWFTFVGANGSSDIDITVVNDGFGRYRPVWAVLPDFGISDHNAFRIDCHMPMTQVVNVAPTRWRTAGVKWDEYVFDLREVSTSIQNFEALSVDDKVGEIYRCVNEVNERRLRKSKRTNAKFVQWFTEALRLQRGNVRRLRKAYQRKRSQGIEGNSWILYRQANRLYKTAMNDAKTTHWRTFVEDQGNDNPWGKVYKLCRKTCRNVVGNLRDGDGLTDSWIASANLLMRGFFPGAPEVLPGVAAAVDQEHTPLSRLEVNEAVFRNAPRKAPGLDGINGDIMRAMWWAMEEQLMALYEQCFTESKFPDAWKVADVVALLKSPDKIRTEPGSYRPISLLSVIGKTLERVMVSRLNAIRVGNQNQYGFTLYRSINDAWSTVKRLVATSATKYVLGVFVDFKGAFDNLLWHKVLAKLERMNCRELGIWKSYFTGRTACMRSVNERVDRDVQRGCPQGSIGGPAVWNLMLDDLLDTLDGLGCKVVAYADDVLLLIEGNTRNQIEHFGEQCMQEVVAWGNDVGVSVSKEKTACMLLKGELRGRAPIVRFENAKCGYVKSIKYLGISVGERMSFKPHLAAVRQKIVNVVGSLRRVLRKNWGLNFRTIRIISRGLFESCAMFGVPAWYEMLRFGYGVEAINRCQRVALYGCLRVCRTVSTEAMQVLMGETPWDLVALRRAAMYKYSKAIPFTGIDPITADECVGKTRNEVRQLVDDRLNTTWQRRWDESDKGRTTYAFIQCVNFRSMHADFDFGLQLGYLLTGHGSMNAYLSGINRANTAECLCGSVREDWKHILVECMLYEDIRKLDEWGIIVENGNVDVSNALQTNVRVASLNQFASEVFARRVALVEES